MAALGGFVYRANENCEIHLYCSVEEHIMLRHNRQTEGMRLVDFSTFSLTGDGVACCPVLREGLLQL